MKTNQAADKVLKKVKHKVFSRGSCWLTLAYGAVPDAQNTESIQELKTLTLFS